MSSLHGHEAMPQMPSEGWRLDDMGERNMLQIRLIQLLATQLGRPSREAAQIWDDAGYNDAFSAHADAHAGEHVSTAELEGLLAVLEAALPPPEGMVSH